MALNVQNINLVALYDGAKTIVDLYRQQLMEQNINASGELSESADFDVDFNEDNIVVYFIYNSYGYYVEHGRKPTTGVTGEKWNNPVQDIIDWMHDKNIVPHGISTRPIPKRPRTVPARTRSVKGAQNVNGTKEEKAAAYAILNKIHRQGWYDPNHQGKEPLKKALEQAKAQGIIDKMYDAVYQGFDKEIEMEIHNI